ncbi:MAG: sugar ABC transporter permease [Acholeplasmataceae bacterium]|nr:sugar ABC transporter permease [Acholeplasmataceae bacterium]
MLEKKKDYHAWLYLAIPLALLTLFTFFPLIKTLMISFDNGYNKWQDAFSFAFSFDSYKAIFNYQPFMRTLWNTVLIVFISVPLSTFLALLIAVGLNSIKPFQKFFQTIFFLPYVTNTIAIGMVFAVLFNLHTGLINGILGIFGIEKLNWINMNDGVYMSSYFRKMFVLQAYILWDALAFKILVFIGGLQNISKQYYDAAKIDSTPRTRVFRKITVPLLSPLIAYILITSFIGAFKTYDAVVGIFGAEWSKTADIQTIVGFVYQQLREGAIDSYSKGAAAAVVLFVIILGFTAINLYVSKKRVHY